MLESRKRHIQIEYIGFSLSKREKKENSGEAPTLIYNRERPVGLKALGTYTIGPICIIPDDTPPRHIYLYI
jgi:hypothetical protein